MSADRTPVIVAAKRTPIGKFMGALSRTKATTLGAWAIDAALKEVPAARAHIDEAFMGSVLQGGLGQNPARQAALAAGLPNTLACMTVNKVCGSGLKSVMLAAQVIKAGEGSCFVAGGMENMSMAPHFTYLRSGVKFGPTELMDMMQHDGLSCAIEKWGMGNAAEWIAREFNISRAEQDRFAVQSNLRAAEATQKGWFSSEIAHIPADAIKAKEPLTADEGFRSDSSLESVGKLKPAFEKDGTITPANASQISDGAAAIIVTSAAKAEELGLKPIARIVGYHTSGVAPKELFVAPVLAIEALCKKTGVKIDQVDLFEINEAFAAQILQNAKKLNIPESKLNIAGGGIALGHPIGASGARVLTTLIHQLRRLDKKRGVAALCLGGGNAVAMMIER